MQACVKKKGLSGEYFFQEGCYITELSNSEDDPNLSIARARVTPGVTTKLHRLSGTVERYIILEGEGVVELADGFSEKLQPYSIVIIPEGCLQQITNTGKEDLLFLVVCSPRFKKENYLEI